MQTLNSARAAVGSGIPHAGPAHSIGGKAKPKVRNYNLRSPTASQSSGLTTAHSGQHGGGGGNGGSSGGVYTYAADSGRVPVAVGGDAIIPNMFPAAM